MFLLGEGNKGTAKVLKLIGLENFDLKIMEFNLIFIYNYETYYDIIPNLLILFWSS